MPHRSPTAADIGKTVEFSEDNETWETGTLQSLHFYNGWNRYWAIEGPAYLHCRVPYSTPDPIAELSMAADLLAERGAPEAARVLMANIEARELIDRIVVSEGIDAGVIWLSAESRTQWNNERQRSEYVNPYFSELGEALVKLSRLIKGTAQCNLES